MTDKIKDIPAGTPSIENGFLVDPQPEKGTKGSLWRAIVSLIKGLGKKD